MLNSFLIIFCVAEQLNATKKNIKHDAATHKLGQEKLNVALQSALELSCILKQHSKCLYKSMNPIMFT